jgi:hypothetical protein
MNLALVTILNKFTNINFNRIINLFITIPQLGCDVSRVVLHVTTIGIASYLSVISVFTPLE